jgi:hypothetical protein
MEKEKTFNVILLGVIFDPKTRKILIGKAKGDENWSFLEGDLAQDEELDVRLKKITNKKTGFIIANLGVIYAKNCIENKKEKLELYFLCEIKEGKEKKGENVEELKWAKPSEIEEHLNTTFPTRLREYLMNLE